tara:strand:+ start:326 stop:493 length:168 start_codon:yes stop_codon:yes gene_type:complete
MIVANTNKINSTISNISMLKKLDPKSKVLTEMELIPSNKGIPQQKKWAKLVKTRI